MKYKEGTVHANNIVIKNERIDGKNYVTMKCPYCQNEYTKPVGFFSSLIKRTGRVSCGCMTKEWKGIKKRKPIPDKIKEWEITKEIETDKYQARIVLAKCPECKEEGRYLLGNLKAIQRCQKCKGKLLSSSTSNKYKRSEPRLYRIWQGMKARCKKPKQESYKKLCLSYQKEWEDFEPFYNWSIKNGYTNRKEIHRIDNSNGYSENNCIWVTRKLHHAIHTVESHGFKVSIKDKQ